ncbi:hypothetical protein Poli38472_000027 [Pythium oligandrum]|uniref:Zinc finger PHD-type domain-containing protein n=1 Tax=Pythium oligandrum TaxID=41045 RepID=A0A8K1FE00_PYTOL|nr:hypothetical protein Poli38472_000027 [Pythium oligandrum]|eukprot:TMW59985.1 hypothetical protein Poli38472_000027 [Pythium oligandrum]
MKNAAAPAASPTSGTPTNKECEQCGNQSTLEVGTNAKAIANSKKVFSSGCQICDFVVYRKSQRPCVHCDRLQCDYFCEWCGKGFHAKCARQRNENVSSPDGFCCKKCEAEQAEDDGDDDDDDEGTDDVNAKCGECRLPFVSTAKESDPGFQVNQSVLVENDEVLYNAVITDVDAKNERIKIHFLRWSKSFDNWYAMDDEHINESLACDCCNRWFHIGCLPPIKSSGRFKDTTYVCPNCLDDAKAFFGGTRSAAAKATKALAASASTSSKPARKSSMSDDSSTKKRSSSKSATQQSESEGEDATKSSKKAGSNEKEPAKKKRKRSNSAESVSSIRSAQEKKARSPIKKPSREESSTTRTSKKRGRSVSIEEDATTEDTHSSPEHTAGNSGDSKKGSSDTKHAGNHADSNTSSDPQQSLEKPPIRRKVSGNHSVSALLNSPSSPPRDQSPQPLRSQAAARSATVKSSKSDALVKVEKEPLSLPAPSRKPNVRSTSGPSIWRTEKQAKPPTSGSSASRGSLSAFDILREVAAQSMSDDLEAESNAPPPRKVVQRGKSVGVSAPMSWSHTQNDRKVKMDQPPPRGNSNVADSTNKPAAFSSKQQPAPAGIPMNSFVDLHFAIRKEMYLRICQLEEERHLERDTAQLLRSLIYPTSDRFHDLKFVYIVNKDLPSVHLTKRLLELVPITAGGTAPVIPVIPTIPPRPSLSSVVSSMPPLLPTSSGSSSSASSPAPQPTLPTAPKLPAPVATATEAQPEPASEANAPVSSPEQPSAVTSTLNTPVPTIPAVIMSLSPPPTIAKIMEMPSSSAPSSSSSSSAASSLVNSTICASISRN